MAGRPPGRQRGSVLLLYPTAVLILLVLGAVAVDSSIAFMAKRDLTDATAAVANDLAIEAVSNLAFYRGGGQVALSQDAIDALADDGAPTPTARVVAQLGPGYHDVTAAAHVVGRCVVVTATATTGTVFARIVPGGPRAVTVSASSAASPRLAAGPSEC